MGLEDFVPQEGGEKGGNSAEVAEKMKEAAKKAASGIKKVQKDEKKAKKHDDFLAKILTNIIKNKKYDYLLDDLILCLNSIFPSSFIVGVLSIIDIEISNEIRSHIGKNLIDFNYKNTQDTIIFDDNNIDKNIQQRINFWMEDIISIMSFEYSQIQMDNFIKSYNDKNHEKDKINLENLGTKMFINFFSNLNIKIPKNKANSYTSFILGEVYNNIKNIDITIDKDE